MIMAAYVENMTAEELTLSLETAQFERQYERALQQAERIYEEERSRALRVQLLLLEDENDGLREQMHDDEDEMHKLESNNDELREHLATMEYDFQAVQTDLKAQLRDLERYRAEVNALNAASADSTKMLSEKLSLTRELATLKPELEHLKSQAAVQQNLLADKLTLERELSAIQVELETEKRAVHRMRTQEKIQSGEGIMIDEIESLKKDVAKEKRNFQKMEREQMKKATEWDCQKETLESKLDAFRVKLRTTKEQLKEAQDELEKMQTAKFAQSAEATKARMNGQNPKKRNVARFDPDMTIGTPGQGGPASKKQRTSVVPGDKSTFSITPFLNRTLSILPESPSEDRTRNEATEQESNAQVDTAAVTRDASVPPPVVASESVAKKPQPKNATTNKAKPNQPLRETTNPKANKIVKKPSLPKVTEEEHEEEQQDTIQKPVKPTDPSVSTEPLKKKLFTTVNRPTLFDDEEDSGPKRTKKLNLTSLRGGGGGSGSGTMTLSKINLGGKNKVLAEFSPLKKDRRAVVAI